MTRSLFRINFKQGRLLVIIFLVATTVRVGASLLIYVARGGSLFEDDATSIKFVLRSARDQANERVAALVDAQPLFYRPLVFVAEHISSQTIALQLVGALLSALVPCIVFIFLSRIVSSKIALIASMTIALYPSQVFFSSLVLKDPYSWFALVVFALLIQEIRIRKSPRRSIHFLAGAFLVSVYVRDLRFHTFMALVVAIAVTFTVRGPGPPRTRLIGIVLATVALFTLSIRGSDQVLGDWSRLLDGTAELGLERTREASGANTTIDCGWLLNPDPDLVQAGWYDDLLCFAPAAKMFLLDPLPHQVKGNDRVAMAMAEHLIWYPLLLGSLISVRRWRYWPTEVIFVFVLALTLVVMWSLIDRNFGTAFRHRGEVLWALVIVNAVGMSDFRRGVIKPQSSSRSREIRQRSFRDLFGRGPRNERHD